MWKLTKEYLEQQPWQDISLLAKCFRLKNIRKARKKEIIQEILYKEQEGFEPKQMNGVSRGYEKYRLTGRWTR